MPDSVFFRGVEAWDRAVDELVAHVEAATKRAATASAAVGAAKAEEEASGPARWPRTESLGRGVAGPVRLKGARARRNVSTSRNAPREGGPGVMSGKLQRSIVAIAARKVADGVFVAQFGVKRSSGAAKYARAVMLGNPRWARTKAGRGGYPAISPAERAMRTQWPRACAAAWRGALSGH